MKAKSKVFVVGLVGGIAAGKSQVAKVFQSLGAAVIDADQLGHQVLQRPVVARRLKELFGDPIIEEDGGSVNRPMLAKLVFGANAESTARLKQLEQVVHPLIHAEAMQLLDRYQQSSTPPPAIVIDAPLLLEAGWASLCDIILYIDAPESVRRERAGRRGWDRSHFDLREQSQWPLDEKRRAATHVVDGTADESELRTLVVRLLSEMQLSNR